MLTSTLRRHALWLAAATASFAPATLLAGPAANPVLAWNRIALDTIRFDNTPPPAAARQLAMLHVAMFDAVNSLGGRHANYREHTNAPAAASREAALAGAANRALRYAWPQFSPRFDTELQAQLLALPNDDARAAGLAWGRQVAQAILAERALDGSSFGVDYRSSPAPGRWQPTPPLFASALLPQWARIRPFTFDRPDRFRPAPPPSLASAEWAQQFNQVRSLGSTNSRGRTREHTEIAWFWADGIGTQSPPGRWNDVAQQLAAGKQLSLLDSARWFALLNLALADAGVACWDAKYAFDWWRPITAIRTADTDGNPATDPDPTWTPLIPTPPFPEHTSGHAAFSAAAATILAALNQSDRFRFTLKSDGLFGTTRRYRRFSDAAAEAGLSRIYGGIHFMAANIEGQECGRRVAQHVLRQALSPRDRR
jgi:hypothetical protein